ncbi:alpha/beta hydrolase family esterase [Candidatus Neomarinimicrobiota bacterium]
MKLSFIFVSVLCLWILTACQNNSVTGEGQNEPLDDFSLDLEPGINSLSTRFGGKARKAIIQTPIPYDPGESYPIVFAFHGAEQNMEDGQSILETIVDDNNIIGVYPQGYLNSWNTEAGVDPSNADDVGYIKYLIQLLRDEGIADTSRFYSIGYSNGGVFNYKLAIETGQFAAIASLAASFFSGTTIPESVPIISVFQIHGDSDFSVPFEGGQSMAIDISFESAIGTANKWAIHNSINPDPVISTPFDGTTLYLFKEENNNSEIRLLKLDDTGHNIFTHNYMNSLTAINEIWDFFKDKRLDY